MTLDTVVLDIDGTLLDSNYHHAVAWSQAFDAVLDRHIPVFAIHRAIGMGGDRQDRDELERAGAAVVHLDCRDLLAHLDEALTRAAHGARRSGRP